MVWSVASSEHPPPAWVPPGITAVDEALVTPFARGQLRTENGPSRWMMGAVHTAEGILVADSQRRWQGPRHAPIAADPGRVPVPAEAGRLRGTWLYGGHWSGHFGHFLLETLPGLWPDPQTLDTPVAGVLMHRAPRGRVPPPTREVRLKRPQRTPWQAELLELAGYGDVALRVVHGRPLRVKRLLVPASPVLFRRWVQPPAVELWRRISAAVGDRGEDRRVYLSRTRFNAAAGRVRSDDAWDRFLDTSFAEAGFRVAHPEELSMRDQIALVRGAEVLAGLSGSALHLAVFADPGTRVLAIGDGKVPHKPVAAQVAIDSACGHRTAFVANGDRAGVERVLADLDAPEVVDLGPGPSR